MKPSPPPPPPPPAPPSLGAGARLDIDGESLLSAVFRSCPVALTVHRWSDRTFVDVNEAFTTLLGWSRDEVLGHTTAELNLVDAAAALRLRTLLEQQRPVRDVEIHVTTRTGETRHVLIGAEAVELRQERHVVTTFVDITERRRGEDARQAAEARYRLLFDYAPDGIAIVSPDGTYLDANPSACRMLGRTHDEMIGLRASDVVVPPEVPHIAPLLGSVVRGHDHRSEWLLRRKDGSVFPTEVIATVTPDGNVLGLMRDITERKRANSRFLRLVESNIQGVLFWNSAGRITAANDAFLQLVGHTRAELEAGTLDWAAMTPPEYAELDRRGLEVISQTGVCPPFEKEYVRRDGSRVAVLVGAAGFEDSSGEGVCFVVDLTERKRLEQQLLRAQRMESIGTLAGGIAHDLNNVLTPILMSVDMLKELATTDDDRAVLNALRTSAERGAELVRQVLSFARGVEGQRITVNPLSTLHELLQVMTDTFPKSIGVRFSAASDLWTVIGDPTQMHQVFLNLCLNARDAMPEGGTLAITIDNVVLDATAAAMHVDAPAGAYVMVQVADSGTGIAPDTLARVFEPFFTTKEVGKGTGLGLSTAMAIVKSHNGFIHLDSEVGRGTTFKVYLPANTSELAATSAAVTHARLPRGRGELVLVVDDEEAIRTIARSTLERFGYRVLLAGDGAEAVALYAQHRADIAVVLTDMAMPTMDGPSTIAALQSMNGAVKIIGSSGLSSNGGVAQAAGAGVEHFVPKPYTAETLLKTLERVLRE